MNLINEAYLNALLADATYALGDNEYRNVTGTDLADLLASRMTPELASYIGYNFKIVTHIETDDAFGSGFDATVWENIDTGKKYVSMQGTVGAGDFLTGVDLTLGNGAPARQAPWRSAASVWLVEKVRICCWPILRCVLILCLVVIKKHK